MTHWFGLAFGLTLAIPGAVATSLPAAHDSASGEEYAVYDAIIERLYVEKKNPSLIVIAKQTESGSQPQPGKGPIIGVADADEMRQALKSIADLAPAYEAENQKPSKLKDKFQLSVDYVFADKAKALALIQKDGGNMAGFNKKYPGSEPVGLIGLSRVGFNPASTEALVYAAHWCGNHCGDAMFLLLVKANGAWKIKYETIASMS
jgi:hypothetical protein